MNLEQLKEEAYKDLPITDQEHLDQESFHNQDIKAKWLDYKSRFELLLVKNKGAYQKLYRDKWEYYGGKADAKVYVSKPFDLKFSVKNLPAVRGIRTKRNLLPVCLCL